MKNFQSNIGLYLLTLLVFGIMGRANGQSDVPLTAQQIFRKVIEYYDPKGRWDTFRGEMTTYNIEEAHGSPHAWYNDIILDNENNFYQTIMKSNDSILSTGIFQGKVFWEIDGKEATEDMYDNLMFKEQTVRMMKEHFNFHFSIPLTLHSAGGVPDETVERKNVLNRDAYVIRFSEIPGMMEDGWYKGSVELFVDTERFSLLGAYWDIEFAGGLTNYFFGEIIIDEIKVPQMRVFFNMEDTSYRQSDVFYPGLLYRDYIADHDPQNSIR